MASNGQKPKESGVDTRFSPLHAGTIRLSRRLGRRSVGQVVRACNDILNAYEEHFRCLRLRPPDSYALTIMGSHFVSQQIEDKDGIDCFQLAHVMRTKLPQTTQRPLKDIQAEGVVILGRGRTKTLVIKLNSFVLQREREAAGSLLCRHIGRTSLRGGTDFVPHISVAHIALTNELPEFDISLLPGGVFLDRLAIT